MITIIRAIHNNNYISYPTDTLDVHTSVLGSVARYHLTEGRHCQQHCLDQVKLKKNSPDRKMQMHFAYLPFESHMVAKHNLQGQKTNFKHPEHLKAS